jgi:hypothetical protein
MQTVRFVNTLDGKEISAIIGYNLFQDAEYFIGLSTKINLIYLVHTKKNHLVTNDINLAFDFVNLVLPNTPDDITIKLFDKSDIDEVMVLASKIHNVDLIPVNFTKN